MARINRARTKKGKSPSKRTSNKLAEFRFTDLPAELRNKIYRYCVVLDKPVTLQYDRYSRPQYLGILPVKASAQILRTCKQLYHEALSVLYGENLFKAPCLVSVKKFSISIGERAATCVQHLSIDFCPRAINMNVDNYQHTYETFAGMSNLKTLEITMCNQLNAQAKVPSALISGSMVPRQSLLLPKRMPNLPRVVVDLFLANDGLEVRFDVLIQFGSDLQYSFFVSGPIGLEKVRIDRYKLAPNSENSGLSLIGRTYNLAYVDSLAVP